MVLALQPQAWAQTTQVKPTAPNNCESIRAQIDSKIAANGVKSYQVTVVDAAAIAPGRVVGSCDKGNKKIMYTLSQNASSTAAPAPKAATSAPTAPAVAKPAPKPANKPIITECADGRVVTSGDCGKKL